jgi:hypothetical protein
MNFTAAARSNPAQPSRRFKFEFHLGPRSLAFMMMWLFIGMVAAYDTYLTVKFQDLMVYLELNPVGTWLMQIDGGNVAIFLGCKFAGTVLVLGIVPLLFLVRPLLGMVVSSSLATAQFCLLLFLLFA